MTEQQSELARRQMQAEIDQLEASLPGTQGDDFVMALMRDQAEGRIAALRAEIQGLESDVFELSFAERASFAKHSLSTTVLSNLLSRFQRAITYAGWARMAGPGVRGTPPTFVARALETEVNAFVPGSFSIELTPYEAALEHLALENALSDFLALATLGSASESATPSDELAEIAQTLGAEATRRFELFFAKVHEAQLEARFERASDPGAGIALQPEQALQVAKWLKAVEERFDTVTVTGTLTAADSNEGRFAITDELGQIHEGKAAPELLSRAVIDGSYIATMRVTTFKSTVTGTARSRAVLELLEPVDAD